MSIETTSDTANHYSPVWTGKNQTPHDFQEHHSPTEKASINILNKKKTKTNQRRIVDNRLWNAMNSTQQKAAITICISFEIMSNGTNFSKSNWEKTPESSNTNYNAPDKHIQMIDNYTKWANECLNQKISHTIILDILCFGHSCRSVDKARRIRKGTARKNLMNGLNLYCQMKGWN